MVTPEEKKILLACKTLSEFRSRLKELYGNDGINLDNFDKDIISHINMLASNEYKDFDGEYPLPYIKIREKR